MSSIALLFDPEPDQWGLRGDPYLWQEMKERGREIPLPEDVTRLQDTITTLFRELVGVSIDDDGEAQFVERYAHGGMSSGHVCLPFWNDKVVPMLVERYEIYTEVTDRFTLKPRTWYAAEFIGDEFSECAPHRNSPILVESVTPSGLGNRQFALSFYHANYPEGVRDKVYNLQTIERGKNFILVRSTDHTPVRLMNIFAIDWDWLLNRFELQASEPENDVGDWLSANWG